MGRKKIAIARIADERNRQVLLHSILFTVCYVLHTFRMNL